MSPPTPGASHSPSTSPQLVGSPCSGGRRATSPQIFPDAGATDQFLTWLQQFSLGPGAPGLLDTLLAATYRQAGIQSLLTTNPADFAVFGLFTCIIPKPTAPIP